MKAKRKIIEIDEEKCNGCGQCVTACAEGALKLVNGKAKLVSDVYCDGLGACLGECPEGALKVIERDADEFSEAAVEEMKIKEERAAKEPEATLPCGCPSSAAMTLKKSPASCACADDETGEAVSELTHWPIKLQLLNPKAPFLKDADLVLLADCVATAYPDLHKKVLKGRAVAMGCPKLDDLDAHIAKLTEILKGAQPKSLTVLHMEVPCCKGFLYAAEKAIEQSGVLIPLSVKIIGRTGEVLKEEKLFEGYPAEQMPFH